MNLSHSSSHYYLPNWINSKRLALSLSLSPPAQILDHIVEIPIYEISEIDLVEMCVNI